ncbi:Rieske 2Fe-2S domain-containing protein [Nostoc sp. HG1]|nr:Rieske 2Fe-2S domain-containing protein [Nostoc sp. HG1]
MNLLQGAPWLLAHRSMLKPDRPTKVSLYGNDYVLWQDKLGKIGCLPNACPHMGAMLSEGWCVSQSEGSAIVCPFHALEFDREGCTTLPGSQKKTLPQMQPLDLIIQNDFIWSYGGQDPKIPIPTILNEIARDYEFIGYTADTSVKTDLLTMLLNMHDYNHQNGTHRELFQITDVQFKKFIDNGLHSEALYDMPTAPYRLIDKLKQPDLFVLPPILHGHLENFFPHLVIFHGEISIGSVKQCHLFIPESETHTRTYVLIFGKAKHPIFNLFKKTPLKFAKVVVEQDADILGKIYPNAPRKVKLNNEVGMDWVRRNFESFPEVATPNLSKSEKVF